MEHLDVLVVGAGLSGIGAGYHLQRYCPSKSYAIFEGRGTLGGTWDLFRYPGIRSDSDMYTLGYSFHPWRNAKSIADGPSILEYVGETAREYGIDSKIRFNHRVRRASWSTADSRWRIEAETSDGPVEVTCSFLYLCTGYYDYDSGYTPEWKGTERFPGPIIHPQKWPEELDYTGKRVVVIGSGATAVTLVPAMAGTAQHVTMLQRSPTYITSLPSRDRIADALRRFLPSRIAYGITRWKNVGLSMFFYHLARRRPAFFKRMLMKGARHRLGRDYDYSHLTPEYDPWDQRLCLIPDADLFKAMKSGKASIVTDRITTFTETGLELESGQKLDADIIVTATGLNMKLMSGLELIVDGDPVVLAERMSYKGMMYSDIPNLASALGYTNASWTLKVDLTAAYICRLLNHMERHGYSQCTPRLRDSSIRPEPAITFTSGYVKRAIQSLPSQGSKKPWKLNQNYALDLMSLRFSRIEDGTLEFSGARVVNGTRELRN